MYILGISGLYHDAAAAIVRDGEVVAAAQEERFTRKKHDPSLPVHAMRYCLEEAGITANELECVVFYDNPLLTLDRFLGNLQMIGGDAEDLFALSFEGMFGRKLWIHRLIKEALGSLGKRGKLFVAEHHISHEASAFYPSPFRDAAILTMDGVGEWATTTIGQGKGNRVEILRQINYPDSIGLLYSAFTYFCGFKVNFGDYKLMGLAPYGKPVYEEIIRQEIIDIKEDGSFRLNMNYFDFQHGRAMTNQKFAELFGGPRREPEGKITSREMDMAASVQKVVEDVVLRLARTTKQITGEKNLVMAGGVALNCVANGALLREKIFDSIWVQPAAGDAGGALGCALYAYYHLSGKERVFHGVDMQKGSYLGPSFSDGEIQKFLEDNGFPFQLCREDADMFRRVSAFLREGKVIGLFEGRMEYGPRALGNRSIIGDARHEEMQSKLNLKIKYRESFRPFAPSVLKEDVSEYFEMEGESPYMLFCADVQKKRRIEFDLERMKQEGGGNLLPVVNVKRSDIPAVTHVDYSARIQTVSREMNPFYYGIIHRFKEETGCSVIINTSFNVRGEPIVCTPEDAYLCFMRTEMDILVLGHFILYKEEQPKLVDNRNWRDGYELD